MANWSRALEEVGEGLLRQQELGGVMYTQAAGKEAARVSGEAKQLESQQTALMERAKIASRHLGDINKELAKMPNIDPDDPILQRGIDAQTRAEAAWKSVYESRGMKMPDQPVTDWTTIATSIGKSLKPKELEDLVVQLKKDPTHEGSLKSIDLILKGPQFVTLSKSRKKQLRDKVVEVMVTMNLEDVQSASRANQRQMVGGGIRPGVAEILSAPSEFAATLMNIPAWAYGQGRSLWSGAPFEMPYQVYEPWGGREEMRSLLGMGPSRGPATQEEAIEMYGPRPLYAGSQKPKTFMGGLISQGDEGLDMSKEAVEARMANARR